jgi:hypothetical protein
MAVNSLMFIDTIGACRAVGRCRKAIKATVAAAMISAHLGEAVSEDDRKNPFTLTYAGEITKNGQYKVKFTRSSTRSTGWISPPTSKPRANYDAMKRPPAIVVATQKGEEKKQAQACMHNAWPRGYMTIGADV